jgi:hypothetical protein
MENQCKYLMTGFALVIALFAGVLVSAPTLKAQNAYGSIVGTVTDSSGAAVPGATVSITNIGTNDKKAIQTDATGNYRFVNLLPAQYRVEFEKTGYKRHVQTPVTVLVDSIGRLDVRLDVGAVTETVEVSTQAPLLQTESGTLGSQVEGKTVEEMPLNGRNVTNLISLVPGVVPQGSSMGDTTMNQGTHTNNAGWGNFQIGGSISGQGSMYLDGAPLTTFFQHDVAFVPTQDAIQEFKVGTNSVSAEFGRYGGGVVEMATKSGTNSFHGTAYEFYRTPGLNANVWNPTKTLGKQQWVQQQYGGTVGGPVLKNKAFFFFSLERFHMHTTAVTSTNVPDAGMTSATDPSVPGNITGNVGNLPTAQQSCLTWVPTDTSYNANGRTHIAASCLDPTAQIVKNYFAPPTNTSVLVGHTNYTALVPLGDDNQQINVRGDVNLAKQSIFLRYSHLNTTDLSSRSMFDHAGFKTGGSISVYPTHQAVVGDTITINPTTIADIRLSYTRAFSDDTPPSLGEDLAKDGFNSNWQAINAHQTQHMLVPFNWNGIYSFFGWGGFIVVDNRWAETYALSADVTKIKGAHTLKIGAQIYLQDINGLPQFNPGTTQVTNAAYAGDEWANFLLGDIAKFTFQEANRVSPYNWYQGYYATDTWTVNHKLTLTAGLRWELPGAISEKHNAATVELPNASATVNGATTAGILALTNSSSYSSRGVNPNLYRLFSPRLGVAYRVSNRLVARAGYALAYLPIELNAGMMATNSPVNLATTSPNITPPNTPYTASNPLGVGTSAPVAFVSAPGNSNPNFLSNIANVYPCGSSLNCLPSGSANSPVPKSTYPYLQQWNLTLGYQFWGQQSLEVGYAGLIGTHLAPSGGGQLNMLPQTSALTLANCMAAAGSSKSAQLTCNLSAQASQAHPSYVGFSDSNAWNSTMTYHSLQAKYTKRVGTGVINSAYTWSKSIGNTDTNLGFLDNGFIGGTQNYNNLRAERSELSYNITQRWITSYIVNLPFGKGQKWLNSTNPAVDRIIGGWSVNGITTLQTGQPLAINQSGGNTYSSSWNAGTIRPDVTPGCSALTKGSAQSRLGAWFKTSCYQKAGAIQYGSVTDPRVNYALGTEPRVDSKLHGPGMANWDFTAQKQTRITESTNLQIRAEFFNIFNRRQFSMPGVSAAFNSTTGAITNAAFGTITTQKNNPRQIQLSARFNF